MDELAAALKVRVAQALDAAGLSQRAVAREVFGSDSGRTTVREWLTTSRTMPAEFVAWVAIRTGADCSELLTGQPSPAGWRLQQIQQILEAPYATGSAGDPADADPDLERAAEEPA